MQSCSLALLSLAMQRRNPSVNSLVSLVAGNGPAYNVDVESVRPSVRSIIALEFDGLDIGVRNDVRWLVNENKAPFEREQKSVRGFVAARHRLGSLMRAKLFGDVNFFLGAGLEIDEYQVDL